MADQPRMVAYYRVSTKRQGESGLGRDAQEAAVEAYRHQHDGIIIRSYEEVESGKRVDRPELTRALADAAYYRATLVVAKLDRLARNVHFLSGLMRSGVNFVACDNPHANPLTIHILAAVAEEEARLVSERTKAALRAYRTHKRVSKRFRELYPAGVPAEIVAAYAGKLGSHRPGAHRLAGSPPALAHHRAGQASRRLADAAAIGFARDLLAWQAEGLSQREMAARLNAQGHTTRRGRPWNHVQVGRVLRRAQV